MVNKEGTRTNHGWFEGFVLVANPNAAAKKRIMVDVEASVDCLPQRVTGNQMV